MIGALIPLVGLPVGPVAGSVGQNALPLTDPSLGNGFSDLPVVFPHPLPGYGRQRPKNLFPSSRDQWKGLSLHLLWPFQGNGHSLVYCNINFFHCTDPVGVTYLQPGATLTLHPLPEGEGTSKEGINRVAPGY